MKWYKRDPDAWTGGVAQLSPVERGIYDTVIDKLYACDLKTPSHDDDRYWSVVCNCNPRTWRCIRDKLFAKGKLYLEPDGQLMARRVRKEYETALKVMRNSAESRAKQLENQRLASEHSSTQPHPQRITSFFPTAARDFRRKKGIWE